MKIIAVDNFDRFDVSDRLVCGGVSVVEGSAMVEGLNERLSGEDNPTFYRLVEDEYVLFEFIGY